MPAINPPASSLVTRVSASSTRSRSRCTNAVLLLAIAHDRSGTLAVTLTSLEAFRPDSAKANSLSHVTAAIDPSLVSVAAGHHGTVERHAQPERRYRALTFFDAPQRMFTAATAIPNQG